MQILEMMLPRLELMATLASDRGAVRDPARIAELREDYRYMAGVCRSLLPHLEPDLAELPEPSGPDASVEARVSYQMALIRRTNRLHLAVDAYLGERAARAERRLSGGVT